MKLAGVREGRSKALLGCNEPLLLTHHGKLSGLYVPLEDSAKFPEDLRRDLSGALGSFISRLLDARGITEEEIRSGFDAHRRRRR